MIAAVSKQKPSIVEIGGKRRHIKGWKPEVADHRDKLYAAPTRLALPTRWDNSGLCSPIEDQGYLGSCTANAATSAMEQLARKLNFRVIQYSRLFVYYWTRFIEDTVNEDSGCYIRDVMKSLATYGACAERYWPYNINQFTTEPNADCITRGTKNLITKYLRCTSLDAIKGAIAQGYPVNGGFAVPENMISSECEQTGIVKYPTDFEAIIGGHAVNFVAFDNTTKMLKFQNSWGTGWGKNGFGFLPYRFFTDGLADDFWTLHMEKGIPKPL